MKEEEDSVKYPGEEQMEMELMKVKIKRYRCRNKGIIGGLYSLEV